MTDGNDQTADRAEGHRLTRRGVLTGAALLGVGAGLDHVIGRAPGSSTSASASTASSAVPFHGRHQAGIATAAQDYLNFAAFDLTTSSREDLRALLARWTEAAATLSAGAPYKPAPGPQPASLPPADTGEAVGLEPAQLTLTFGFGPGMFAAERFGLSDQQPPGLQPLPPFSGEQLQADRSGGDLCVQACANDPQVAFHAIHTLSRVAAGVAQPRWTQLGFGRTSNTTRAQITPRNLMGFKDGTENIHAEDAEEMERFVWLTRGDGPAWMTDGSYLIARRIRILFGGWDTSSLEEQQRTIGREKLSGAPLGESAEYDPVDLAARDAQGNMVIPNDAHIRIASPQTNGGQRILRRGYSYSDGNDPVTGELDAGLFFISFQRSPNSQFIPLQLRLSSFDALSRHTLHTSSAIFACPGGVAPGGHIGQGIFS